jgi:chromosome segregation ATPase
MVLRNVLNADVVTTDVSIEQPSTLPPMPQEAVTHIERLLVAIDRLRCERDNLQRDMHFLETESKFAIEALKAELAALPPLSSGDEVESAKTIKQLKTEIDALRVQLTAAAGQGSEAILAKDKQIEWLTLAATASAVAIQHLQSQSDYLERRYFDVCHSHAEVEDSLENSQNRVEELEKRLRELEVKLDVTELCLEATTGQRNDVMTQLEARDAEREDEVREVKSALRETRDNHEQAEIHLANVSKALEGVESERDSLALQIKNLSTDLRAAQEDLTDAEGRYSTLQSHQLSSMSSSEATRLLKHQIEELEMRVMRRTEQIGIHQHDIKRLETNLRLQEERLGEMTTELEMMAAQKDAMVEDCADAREARDEALARLDRLEVDMEMRMEESDNVAAALVAVVFETVNHSRDALRRSNDRASKEVDLLNAAHQNTLDALRSSDENAHQSTIALAVSYAAIQEENPQGDLMEERAKTASLRKQLESLESQTSKDAQDFSVRSSELEGQIARLQNEISSAEVVHHAAIDELVRSQQRLQKSLDEAQGSRVEGSPQTELAHIKARHGEELEDVQSRLIETSAALKELQARHGSAETEHRQALLKASETKQELERLLAETSESLRQSLHEQQKADRVQKEASAEISRLRGELDVALTNARNAQISREELQSLYDRVLYELAQVQQTHETRIANLTDQSLAVRQELEGKLADLQLCFDDQSGELDNALRETSHLSQKLQESLEQLSAVKDSHQEELRSVDQKRHNAESTLGQHQREMSIAKSQFEQSRIDLAKLQEEKLSLQEEITSLEAEFQRSISLRRFLESQAQDRSVISLLFDCVPCS